MLAPSIPSFRSGRGTGSPLGRSLRLLTPSVARAGLGVCAPNRRREMRRGARLGCRVRCISDWSLLGDRTLDLSPQGMLLLSDERIESGQEVVVSFQATELPIWFDTMATVVRTVEGRRPGDDGRALGLRFESLPFVSRLILRGHLRKFPLTTARRDVPIPLGAPKDPDYAQIVKDIWAGAEGHSARAVHSRTTSGAPGGP